MLMWSSSLRSCRRPCPLQTIPTALLRTLSAIKLHFQLHCTLCTACSCPNTHNTAVLKISLFHLARPALANSSGDLRFVCIGEPRRLMPKKNLPCWLVNSLPVRSRTCHLNGICNILLLGINLHRYSSVYRMLLTWIWQKKKAKRARKMKKNTRFSWDKWQLAWVPGDDFPKFPVQPSETDCQCCDHLKCVR